MLPGILSGDTSFWGMTSFCKHSASNGLVRFGRSGDFFGDGLSVTFWRCAELRFTQRHCKSSFPSKSISDGFRASVDFGWACGFGMGKRDGVGLELVREPGLGLASRELNAVGFEIRSKKRKG